MRRTTRRTMPTAPKTTLTPTLVSGTEIWERRRRCICYWEFRLKEDAESDQRDKELGFGDARDFDRLALANGHAALLAGGRGVPAAALDVGDFTDAGWRDRCDDGGGGAEQVTGAAFTRALDFMEHGVEKPEDGRGDDDAAKNGERQADPDVVGGLDARKDHAKAAKGSQKGTDRRRTERGNAGHAGMFKAGVGMAAGADIDVGVGAAEVMAEEEAENSKDQTDEKTEQIYVLFHRRNLSFAAGCCRATAKDYQSVAASSLINEGAVL